MLNLHPIVFLANFTAGYQIDAHEVNFYYFVSLSVNNTCSCTIFPLPG